MKKVLEGFEIVNLQNHFIGIIVYLFAFNSTNPDKLKRVNNPIGFNNDAFIIKAVRDAETVKLAWDGEKRRYLARDEQVID
ncbi:hypothetical protein QFZ31_001126 [Neobacillus niacini]|uniref:DUF1643 domain-containing protein n=1 Tax=Neobacillus driksii TaxID=3035913 RepID=UPI00277F5051|nr:DUF1643 domain-containing protein [Neobacillus niacini]MDQ0971248.1 hypothetical protein [Neobacillus niacini]